MSIPLNFDLPTSDIKDFLYSECLSKFNIMLTDALKYFTKELYLDKHALYIDNLKKIIPELLKIDDFISTTKISELYKEFDQNRIKLISNIFEHLSQAELNDLQASRLLSKMSPAIFLYLNHTNYTLVDKTRTLYKEWWDECFNVYDFVELIDADLETDTVIAILQSVCRFCHVQDTFTDEEDDSYYIAYGIMPNIQPWLLDISKSENTFKYTLLTYRHLFIQLHLTEQLNLFDTIGHELYGKSMYALLCSMIDHSSQACNPLFWRDMHLKIVVDSDVSLPELLTVDATCS